MNRLYVWCLLDATGSMGSIKGQTISAFNEYFESLRDDPEVEEIVSLGTFNSKAKEQLWEAERVGDVDLLTEENYRPGWNTPLYDAVAWAIKRADKEWKNKRAKRLLVILTDGFENASREHDEKTIAKMIHERREQGWEVSYLGANQDSWAIAARMGIAKRATADFAATPEGVRGTSQALASASSNYASSPAVNLSYSDEERKRMKAKKD